MAERPTHLASVCVFCGSSMGGKPVFQQVAHELGQALAAENLRLVYGGGGVGLMGTTARAAHEAGGQVLGIMPDFLRAKERLLDEVETVVVEVLVVVDCSHCEISWASIACWASRAIASMPVTVG